MSDQQDVSRENRKRELRRRVVTEPLEPSEEELQEVEAEVRRYRLRRLCVAAAVLGCALLAFLLWNFFTSRIHYETASVVWEKEAAGESTSSFVDFGDGVLQYSTDGMSYLDRSGNTVWNYGYSMRNPSVTVNGDYGAVADLRSQTAYIFHLDGVQGTVQTNLSILNLTVSAHGVLALVLDDSDANYIDFYDRNGTKLDISVRTALSGEGYPLDLSLSPTGTGLAVSIVYMDQGSLQSRIAFYNFDVGQSEADRVVGYFRYGETLFPEVRYLTDTLVCAFGDGAMVLYSLENEAQPEQIQEVAFQQEIQSVMTSQDAVGVVERQGSGSYLLHLYNTAGEETMTAEIPFLYTCGEFSGNYLVFYNETECLVLDRSGKEKFHGTLEGTTRKLFFLNRNTLLQFSNQGQKEIRLR